MHLGHNDSDPPVIEFVAVFYRLVCYGDDQTDGPIVRIFIGAWHKGQ